MGRERERGDSGIRSHKWVGRERCPKPARKREKIQNKNCIFIASYLFRVEGELNRSFSSSFYTRCDGAVSISHIYVYNLDNYSLLENCRMHRLFFTKRPMSMAWFIINGLKHAHDWTRPNWPAFLTIDLPTNHRRLILLSSFFFYPLSFPICCPAAMASGGLPIDYQFDDGLCRPLTSLLQARI